MIGGIAGDIIGSTFEALGYQSKRFRLFADGSRFTDDTVLAVAVADRLMRGGDDVDLLHEYFHRYPHAGAIAEAFDGGLPPEIETQALAHLDEPLRNTVERFRTAYPIPRREQP